MNITELINEKVTLSRASITCKRDGKTAGIVRADRFTELPPRVASEYWSKLKRSGLWNAGKADRVYASGGKLYYLLNKKHLETLQKLAERDPSSREELDRLNLLTSQAAELVTVIPCYIEGGI